MKSAIQDLYISGKHVNLDRLDPETMLRESCDRTKGEPQSQDRRRSQALFRLSRRAPHRRADDPRANGASRVADHKGVKGMKHPVRKSSYLVAVAALLVTAVVSATAVAATSATPRSHPSSSPQAPATRLSRATSTRSTSAPSVTSPGAASTRTSSSRPQSEAAASTTSSARALPGRTAGRRSRSPCGRT